MARIALSLTLALALSAGAAAQPGTVGDKPAANADAAKDVLTVGKKAPELKVSGWLKGEPVQEFGAGQVYVVEAWATWCGPCRQSIPHLTELQKEFGEKVKFVGVDVSEQDWESVPEFVKEMGDQMAYRVAQDRDATFDKAWMQAAQQGGIPTAFVVNQQGMIAFIGHPMELDGVLPKVVDGTWDLKTAQAAAEAKVQRMGKLRAADKQIQEITGKMEKAWRAGKKEEAIGYVDQLVAIDGEAFKEPAAWKAEVLVKELGKTAEAHTYIRAMADGPMKDQSEVLNGYAWLIVDAEKPETRDLKLAEELAKRADELTKGADPNVQDTLARVLFLKGDVDGAIKTLERALPMAEKDAEMKQELEDSLKTYKAAKAGVKPAGQPEPGR